MCVCECKGHARGCVLVLCFGSAEWWGLSWLVLHSLLQEVLGELLVEEASAYVLGQEEADLKLNQVRPTTGCGSS